MTISADLSTEEGRLASFDVVHPAPKRRASAASSKSSKGIKWPHSSPSPQKLAKAGFYYKPTPTHVDNVACFLCQKALDGWEEEDDPIAEHLHHSESCGWAICAAVLERCDVEDRNEDHPLSQRMLEARRATFQNGWPHEKKKGWIPKIEKMIAAGWHFSPSTELGMEDLVTCAYCALSLDGWEPKDDPMTEHQRRQSSCIFFSLAAQPSEEIKAAPAKKGRASKALRTSTQSEISLPAAELSFVEPQVEGDSLISVQSKDGQTAMARKGAKGKTGKAPASKARATKKRDPVDMDAVSVEPEDADFEVKVTTKIPKRGKKRGSDQMDIDKTEDDTLPPKKRATRTRSSSMVSASRPDIHSTDISGTDAEMIDLAPPKTRGKSGRAKAPARTSAAKNRTVSAASVASLRMHATDDEDIDQALEEDLDRMLLDGDDSDLIEESKATRRKPTRTKAGPKQAPASIAPVRTILDDGVDTDSKDVATAPDALMDESSEAPKGKTTKSKKAAKGSSKQNKKGLEEFSLSSRAETSTHLETPTSPAIKDAAKMLLGSSPVYTLPQPKGRAKRANSRQTSRQMPGRKTRMSALSMANSTVAPSSDVEVCATSMQDDSGHDTDASVASQSTIRRGGTKRTSNTKRGKTGKKAGLASGKIEDILGKPPAPVPAETEQGADQDMLDLPIIQTEATLEKETAASQPPATKAFKAKPKSKAVKASAMTEAPPAATADSPVTITAAPAKVEKPINKIRKVTAPKPKAVIMAPARSTPSPSPQSSDAENQPPSSRALAPASTNIPGSTRIPLSTSTPQTSPSKRNLINGRSLRTATEWTALDLETVFLPTFDPSGGKENTTTLLLDNTINGALMSPEKKMTVEEWIKFNASLGEERLRSECERIVSVFEREGNRAVAVLEGIEVVE